MVDGGYEDGYAVSSCFWGETAGSYVAKLVESSPSLKGATVLDAGCGDGKNSAFLDSLGTVVTAIDCSAKALANARARWRSESINWIEGDIRSANFETQQFDLVIAYGLLHCMRDKNEIAAVVAKLKGITKLGGYNVVCAFNSRSQDIGLAHPRFTPCLLPHSCFLKFYEDWSIQASSDEDLTEAHPHNRIVHTHSMTRIIARYSK